MTVTETLDRTQITRRRLLAMGITATAIGLAPVSASARSLRIPQKVISFRNAYSQETAKLVYWENGRYVVPALRQISYVLRDHNTGQVKLIDPRLLDILHDLQVKLAPHGHFEVFSGYRSPKTNAELRRHSRRVAKNSLHMQGRAADVKLTGVRPSQLARAARDMERGGVGYYRRFVHLDTGDVRTWGG
jgi:uncharacterized protein YcbK (DUF882 family)